MIMVLVNAKRDVQKKLTLSRASSFSITVTNLLGNFSPPGTTNVSLQKQAVDLAMGQY